MIRRLAYSTLTAVAVLSLAACEETPSPETTTATISGTVAYRERIVLPPSAQVKVALVDVSLADAPSVTIAETVFTPEGNVPIPYTLSYDSSKIIEGHTYALQARVTEHDKLLFITDTHYAALGENADTTDLLMVKVQ